MKKSSLPLDSRALDALPVAVVLCSADGRLLRYNVRAAELWGRMPALDSDEERYSGAFRLLTPGGDVLPHERAPMADALRMGREVRNAEVVVERPDGSRLAVSETASPLRGRDGAIAGGVAVLHEVSERRRAEDRERLLLQASTLLGASLDHQAILTQLARVPLPLYADWCVIHVLGEDGALQGVAGAHVQPEKEALVHRLLHYPSAFGDVTRTVLTTGDSFIQALVPSAFPERPPDEPALLEALRALEPESLMVAALKARGKIFGVISFVLSGSNRRYEPNDLPLAEGIARRAALAIDNARLYRESERANRLKDEFLATLSHELRTPLNAILGWTQLLLTRQLDPADADRALMTIRRNAEAQARLVSDVLDVSRIITGKLRLKVGPVDVAGVIDSVVESLRPAAEAREIQLYVGAVPPALTMLADPDRVQQIIWNLLSNAVKFTPPGGRVDLTVEVKDRRVEVTVRDTGAGIHPDFLPSLFERFRQADASTTRAHGGLGLGLAIVRHLVELHGGTVRGESEGEGRGATFTVALPIHLPPGWASESPAPAEHPASPAADVVGEPLKGVSVLVVDDDPDSLHLAVKILQRAGAQVEPADSVAAAVAALEKTWPTAIVADIGMPYRDGFDLIGRVRALEVRKGRHVPVAALTAYAAEADRRRALMAGFDAYLAKPIDPGILTSAVAQLVGRMKGQEEARNEK